MDKHLKYTKKWKRKLSAGVLLALSLGGTAYAMPTGGQIQSGQGTIAQNGKNMTVTQQSGKMAVDWTQFNIARDEAVKFAQPGRDAVALNRITGGQKSVIDGALSANGNLFLVNPNGVVFGKTSSIEVGSLVASTAQLSDTFMKSFAGSTANLNLTLGEGNNSAILNEGTITAQGGLVALHAAQVENTGTISNPGGTVALAAAKQLTLSPDSDGKLNYAVDGELAQAKALNSGRIQADGGYVVMTAKSADDVLGTVVNNTGTIEAKTLRQDEKGQILLDGGQSGQVEVSGTLDASGTDEGQSAGSIKVIGQKTLVHDNTNLLAKGNVDGGKIETSGDVLSLGNGLTIDAKGTQGKAGEWLLDPLDVIIADSDPTTTSNYDNAEKKTAADSDFTSGSASIGYNDPDATTANASSVNSAVTWISTDMVEKMLNAGTNVTIQAAATNGSANIIVKNDIEKTAGKDATFTLDAMRNITINGNISSTSNKLNVVLNADSNGDQIGAVIINANIDTNGGDFTSATGGTVKYASDSANTKGYGKGTLTGKADPTGHTVGTYFGHVDSSGTADGAKDDRLIKTSGGKITLNGEIAIGLNGGTLTLDSGGGDVTATGIINSGNSYGAYVYGTDTWDTLVEKTVENYLKSGTVPAYHYQGVNYVKDANGNYVKKADGTYEYTTEAQEYAAGQPHYTFSEADTQNVRWLGDGSSTSVSVDKGKGYASVVITKGSMTLEQWLNYQLTYNTANFANRYISQDSGVKIVTETVGNKTNTYVRNADGSNVTAAQFKTYLATALSNLQSDTASTDTTKMLNGETVYNNLKDDISHLLATNWFASKELAQGDTKGGSAVGDSYLATITTILENSLTTPNGQQILWAGGRGSGVLNKTGSTNNDKAYPYSYYGMPDDPTYQDGMYWVTGPEGEANNGKGTQFYSNANSNWKTGNYGETVYGYVNWDTYKDGNKTRSQPDNSAPFLTVGYGTTGKWDDAAMGGDTTVGFIKETNLANSSLNIKAGTGTVSLEGDIGKGKALDTVNIESTGAVTIGNEKNTATNYKYGTIYADHGVYLSGGTVSVGGEIHSGTTDTTSSASDIATRTDGYQNTAFQLDSVTIQAAGDLTVHGMESNGYTDSNNTLNGGKISLTSTGDKGRITLDAGVDYKGEATEGTLAAASTAEGAVVVDAQGSQGSLVNSTTGTSAITTGTGGTWQVYVNSPSDYGTSLGSNLISGTNAQWTAKSDANSTVLGNSSGNTLTDYTDTSSNKFIFQVTPVITISGGSQQKTYGDTLTDDQLRDLLSTSATYKDSNGSDIDVTQFSNFKEAGYLTYVTSSDGTKTGTDAVAVSSDGAAAGATRTQGDEDKTASDGKKAFYVFHVDENGAKALNGYDLKTVNGDIEILRKTLTISTDGTQTYGNTAVTNGMPSYDKTQLVNGDTLGDIQYTIATDGSYADSKGSNDTAHVGSYDKQYLTSSAEIKASDGSDASANYEVTGSGTLTVNPADLYLTVGDVSTTYGTAFDTDKYTYTIDTEKGGLVNGDTQASVLGDSFLNYTNTGAKTDASNDKVKTQNAGTYALQGAASKDLSDYTVHITDGKSTVEKAKLTLTVGDVNTVYGNDFDKSQYTYTISGNANGDTDETLKNNQISVTYTNTGEKTDANNDKVKTQDVGDWKLIGNFTVAGDTANNYDVTYVDGTSTVTPAEIHLKLNDVSTTYGTAFDTSKYGYDASKLVMANGDSTDVVTKAIGNGDITYTNTGDAADPDNENVKTQNAGTGYKLTGTTEKTLQNYKVFIDGADSTVDKADLTLTLKDVSTTYGQGFDSSTYGYKKDAADLQGLTNGDAAAAITDVLQDSDFTYVNGGAKSDPNNENVKTQNAGSYQITGSTAKTLDNYNIKVVNPGTSTVKKAKLTLTVGDVSTVYGTGFDKTKYTYTISGNANGDTDETLKNNQISVTYTNTGEKTDANNDKVKTQDVGDWKLIGDFTVAGDTANNYEVSYVNGTSAVTPAEIHLKLNDVSTTYGTAFDTGKYGYDASKLDMANGDSTDVVTKAIANGDITYTNTGDATDPDKIAKGAKTQDAGTGYQLTGTTEKTLKNYTVKIDGADASIDKATLKLKVRDYTEAYGAADKVGTDLKQTEVTGEQNGDDLADLVSEIGIHNTSKALLSDTRTNDVKYKADGSLDSYRIDTQLDKDTLKNYNLELSEGTMTLTPVAITVNNEMIQTYGSADRSFKEIATPPLVNGDTISTAGLTMTPKAGGAYETNRAGRTTADAGIYKNDLESDGGGIVHENGSDARKNYLVTITGDVIVKKADLTVTTKDVTTPFGTVKFTTSGVQGLTNGDAKNVSDLKFNYGSYGNAYLDNNSYTNAPGRYEFTTETTNQYLDFLKNYNILGGDATVTITPVERPVKPDITPDRPNPVPEGKGEVEEPSMDDFRGEEEHRDGGRTWYREKKSIPFFKVLDGKVTNYGTFDVESLPEKVQITPSGMRLPEPDQAKTQHREYTTTLTLPGGEGSYRLVYNGVSFNIHPVDAAALQLLEAGDPKKNKELSEAALHTGFQKMGLGLEDLKAVYVRFN
ncbi:filamentous hemagglutinin N-terminal domain-containing protein [Acidaminococcus massiliensis]|jgi:filamentous hemagglutinin family protein|uniref:two-partner secretion domain-containing protein n=1 Tax=Acidaminococcus massiliensis TaxID=1852375 RepID=UPI0023EF5E23|nr:filamentous hemagglutinin N-terminal domain-containing protein [Acidaminococcus massiliensis]